MLRSFLKEYIAGLLSPTPIMGVLLLIGLTLLIKKKQSSFRYSYFLLLGFFSLTACNIVPDFLLNSYETSYPKFQFKANNSNSYPYIVVLGGGLVPSSQQPLSSQLTSQTLTRLVEGIRIHKLIPKSKIIFTGKGYTDFTEAMAMGLMAQQLGIKEDDILLESQSKNTHDHPQYLKHLLKGERFVLVTSALHMPRAMTYFKAAGLNPTPAPTQYILKGNYKGILNNIILYPSGENLAALDQMTYELWALLVAFFKTN